MQIKKLYVVHHSHTDIGYTDLQERVVYTQANQIKKAIAAAKADPQFRWNCETWYCVLEFLKRASAEEKADFFELARQGRIGISATYLNFNDLADIKALDAELSEMDSILQENNLKAECAMIADINGISMGQRDLLIKHNKKFLYTNIHCHHGMYPLFQNQNAYFWQNEKGEKLLVWNGEHYNLGNFLGLIPPNIDPKMMRDTLINDIDLTALTSEFSDNLKDYLQEVEAAGYPYDFIVMSVSGVFSDNAPPNPYIAEILRLLNSTNDYGISAAMVSLDELFCNIKDKVKDAPVLQGDLNDWWANGIGSTPYPVKHYKEAQRMRNVCDILDKKAGIYNKKLIDTCNLNLLLYAEHTWGHSSTESEPYTTMVQNLDIRKNSYASKAHEAAAMRLNEITHKLGDRLNYYAVEGKLKAASTSDKAGLFPVEFYIETMILKNVLVTDANGKELTTQVSYHPRGKLITFVDYFDPYEIKEYSYKILPEEQERPNRRVAYIGAERIKDIANDFDKISYRLPYGLENDALRISWKIGEGITSVYDKKAGKELLLPGFEKFLTPIYERTKIKTNPVEERRLIGRNVKGAHAEHFVGKLVDAEIMEHGDVYTLTQLKFELEGTDFCAVQIKLYYNLPRIDFTLRTAKTISSDIESIYLPLCLNAENAEKYIKKGGVIMRPGIDQLPGTCMEYNMTDDGVAYIGKKGSILINCKDTPLIYTGGMDCHEIKLCAPSKENNDKPIFSWVMNNTWETNFKMDLSGYGEFCYSLELSDETNKENCFKQIGSIDTGVSAFIID